MTSAHRTRRFRWLAAGAFVAGALIVGCTYSPDIESGALQCSAGGECPRGYRCSSGLCCSPDDLTCGGTKPGPDAAVAGDGTAYVGTWAFSSTATLDTECPGATDGGGAAPFLTQMNPSSTITISNNGNGTLKAVWSEWTGCPYTLSVDSTGAHGADSDTWACEYTYDPTATNPPQLSDQLWVYDTFHIVTPDGATATHDGLYSRQDTYSDGSVVHCTQTLHAPMTKQ